MLCPIDPRLAGSRKAWKFSTFPKRDGEWHWAGCIGTSLSGSWRSSYGSCLAGRLFPGDQRGVRTGKESSASNITPPATEAERPNVRFISKLGASNSTGVGIIANRGGEARASASSMVVHPILRSVCNFAPVGRVQQAARPRDQLQDESSSRNSLYPLFCCPLASSTEEFRNSDRRNSSVFEMSLILFPLRCLLSIDVTLIDRS